MVLKIRKQGDSVLRETAKEVYRIDLGVKRLVEDMFETMYAAGGVGLAAPQVGVSKRIIVVDVGNCPIALVNPVIIDKIGEQMGAEGCLSLPGLVGTVSRAERVSVTGTSLKGAQEEFSAEGLFARALQHEIDHLDGILFVDMASKIRRQ